MSAFMEVYGIIKKRTEDLYEEWQDENKENDKDRSFEDFIEENVCCDYNNYNNYKIDEELLNNSYREGSMWILRNLREEHGWNNDDELFAMLDKIAIDNNEYLKEFIFWVGYEM